MTLEERVIYLEGMVRALLSRSENAVSRGVTAAVDDGSGVQRQRVYGAYGEELDGVQVWQPFGLSAHVPAGADLLMVSMNGNRDGAQAIAVTHPDFRPSGTEAGGTVLYDAFGNTITLGSGGVTINSPGPVEIEAASSVTIRAEDVSIISNTLTHNGVNIGDDHTHSGVDSGPSNTGEPN